MASDKTEIDQKNAVATLLTPFCASIGYLSLLVLGYIFTMPIAGVFCDSYFGWQALYYLQGALTLILFSIFYVFYRDTPYGHKLVSNDELSKIEKSKNTSSNDSNKNQKITKVPYKSICSDLIVWGIVTAITFLRCGSLLFVQFGPVYLNKVLKFDFKRTGVSAALPYIGSILAKIVAGFLYDFIKCVSMKNNLRIFVSISSVL
uniref:Major facilitator superfamily (MFS) profile domain-containing protein n=1 Tax=Acrobeloides nanus TaxID=290746 RepID=A0A914CH00_9BILA